MQETQLICSASALNRRVQGQIPGNVSTESHSLMPYEKISSQQQLRKTLRTARRSLRPSQQKTASHLLSSKLLNIPEIKSAKHIAVYYAGDGEISLAHFMQQHTNVRFYLPKINTKSKNMSFHHQASLKRGCYKHPWGFSEPCNKRARPSKKLDVVLLPLVAFTRFGERMGMGGGFYDRAFSYRNQQNRSNMKKPILIGVAHESQKTEQLNTQNWDVNCDIIITDSNIYRAKLQKTT